MRRQALSCERTTKMSAMRLLSFGVVIVWLASHSVLAADDFSRGQTVYIETCIACHAVDGAGSFPGVPDLTGKTGLLSQDDAVLLLRMTDGFQTPGSVMAMPPRGGNPALSDADMLSVLKYMRKEFQQD